MTKRSVTFATVAGTAIMLAGCQSAPLAGWSFGKQERGRLAANPKVEGSAVLEEGRAYLREGNISKAVASFQMARMDKDSAAAANNGLAVAYAKLGRPDLAERYFRTAAMLDPSEGKYVANLLRLQGQAMLAQRAEVKELAAAPETTAAQRPAAAPVHRVSHGEFRITTVAPTVAPTMRVESRKAAQAPVEVVDDKPAPQVALAEQPKVTKQFEVIFGQWLQK